MRRDDRTAMRQTQCRASRRMPDREGFTFLELTVAMVVLGVALAGLFPLLAITSRQLQPIRTNGGTPSFDCRTPSRDWGKNASDPSGPALDATNQRHTWYLTPVGGTASVNGTLSLDNSLWVRKLGASAQPIAGNPDGTPPAAFTSYTPPAISAPPSPLVQDDGDPGFVAGTMTSLRSGGYNGNCHTVAASTTDDLLNVATWSFTAPADGWYLIVATWPTDGTQTLTQVDYKVTVTLSGQVQPPIDCPLNQGSPGTALPSNSVPPIGWWPILPANTPPANTPCIFLHKSDAVAVTMNVPKASAGGVYAIADAVCLTQYIVKIATINRSIGSQNSVTITNGGVQQNADVAATVSVSANLPP